MHPIPQLRLVGGEDILYIYIYIFLIFPDTELWTTLQILIWAPPPLAAPCYSSSPINYMIEFTNS